MAAFGTLCVTEVCQAEGRHVPPLSLKPTRSRGFWSLRKARRNQPRHLVLLASDPIDLDPLLIRVFG